MIHRSAAARVGRLVSVGLSLALAACAGQASDTAARASVDPPGQVAEGQKVYAERCAACHGSELAGRAAPPLVGDTFWTHWAGQSSRRLYAKIRMTMPPTSPGSLSESQAVAILAFVVHSNGLPEVASQLRALEVLQTVTLPAKSNSASN